MAVFRFVCTGVRGPFSDDNYTLVEYETNDIDTAVMLHDWLSCSGYKARIYDNDQHKFITQNVIDLALKFYATN